MHSQAEPGNEGNGTIDPCKQTVGDPCFACGTVDLLNKERFDVYVYLGQLSPIPCTFADNGM